MAPLITMKRPIQVEGEFPILDQLIRGKRLAYLDNAATSQRPEVVLRAMDEFTRTHNSNVHRGVHLLSQLATDDFEAARVKVAQFINAPTPNTVVFVRGTTEGVNLVANGWGLAFLKPGDAIALTEMEHHSNILPWQLVAERVGATIVPIRVTDTGEIDLDSYQAAVNNPSVKLVAFTHISNVLGTVNPVKELVALAHAAGVKVLVDGAQGIVHRLPDVQDWDVDFYTFSGHKFYGPMGIGALYAKREMLEAMVPYQGGGEMIHVVTLEKSTYAPPPAKFEAGTPNVTGAVGFAAAIDFFATFGTGDTLREKLATAYAVTGQWEDSLARETRARLSAIPAVKIIGTAPEIAPIVSFVMEKAHPHDVGQMLDYEGVAVRTGHHCCQPLMKRFGLPATTRASFAAYNTLEDVEQLIGGVGRVAEVFL